MTNPEEIENKIQQLKTNVQRIEAIADTLNSLISESELNDLLKVEFASEILGTRCFGIFKTLENTAFEHLKTIYP